MIPPSLITVMTKLVSPYVVPSTVRNSQKMLNKCYIQFCDNNILSLGGISKTRNLNNRIYNIIIEIFF